MQLSISHKACALTSKKSLELSLFDLSLSHGWAIQQCLYTTCTCIYMYTVAIHSTDIHVYNNNYVEHVLPHTFTTHTLYTQLHMTFFTFHRYQYSTVNSLVALPLHIQYGVKG
jgi:hypothetical protein